MAAHQFPFSASALRSLQLEAEQQEKRQILKKLKLRSTRPLLYAERSDRPSQCPPLLCTDPVLLYAMYNGDRTALQDYMGVKCSANLMVQSRNHELRWKSHQTGIWSLTYEEEFTCPLFVTASRGYVDCVQLLLRKGADVEFSPSGESALHGACENAHTECVKILLRHGANPNAESQDGTFPLHRCKIPESYHCAKMLLQYGAHVNRATEDEEHTPLHTAARHGMWEHVDLYLRYAASSDKRNANGETPLCVACGHPQTPQELPQYFQVCQRLVEGGANIHIRDNDQQSPLHLACKSANPQIVQLLLEHGAEVNAMSYSANTAMQYILQVTAYKLDHQPELIVRALLNHGAIRIWPGALIKVSAGLRDIQLPAGTEVETSTVTGERKINFRE
uniref:Ankyrin repeat and SOCS box containing 10 n=1 Tax=Leptobrachium leishanense TaxID=445787 RepID=A0A8C5QDR1_9ANUR